MYKNEILKIASDASSMNQCAQEKEQAKPTDSSRNFFCLSPIVLSNAFSCGAMQKVANFWLVI